MICHIKRRVEMVPILEHPNGSRDGYVASMSGFLLDWAGASGDCPKCVASGGQCTYGDGLRFACNCTDGLHPGCKKQDAVADATDCLVAGEARIQILTRRAARNLCAEEPADPNPNPTRRARCPRLSTPTRPRRLDRSG